VVITLLLLGGNLGAFPAPAEKNPVKLPPAYVGGRLGVANCCEAKSGHSAAQVVRVVRVVEIAGKDDRPADVVQIRQGLV
jgi:hypothetical protein